MITAKIVGILQVVVVVVVVTKSKWFCSQIIKAGIYFVVPLNSFIIMLWVCMKVGEELKDRGVLKIKRSNQINN